MAVTCMAGATWNCCLLSARSVYTIQQCTSLQYYHIWSHIHWAPVWLPVSCVTCHLHFWQNDWKRDLSWATEVIACLSIRFSMAPSLSTLVNLSKSTALLGPLSSDDRTFQSYFYQKKKKKKKAWWLYLLFLQCIVLEFSPFHSLPQPTSPCLQN